MASFDHVRTHWRNFDNFEMQIGASKMNLKIIELPVRYHAREYGETQISRFRDGFILLQMSAFAWHKLKAL